MTIPQFTKYPSTLAPSTFSADMDQMISEYAAVITAMNDTGAQATVDAETATAQAAVATAQASAAVAAAGAALWVSGTTYAIGNGVYSPIDFQSYRRITAGAGTTDPSLDATNWTPVSASPAAGMIMSANLFGAI